MSTKTAKRKTKPAHLRTVGVSIKTPQWVKDWVDANEESAGHIFTSSVVNQHNLVPPQVPQ